jgi:small multidrug resistance family-3 protein
MTLGITQTRMRGPDLHARFAIAICPVHIRATQTCDNARVYPLKTLALFVITAIAEIVGCYLPYLWLRQGKSAWLLVPGVLSLVAFAYLLTLHPTAAGRVYAAYGGVYVSVALMWLWLVDAVKPTRWDLGGVALCLLGMSIIMFGPRSV